MFIIRPDLRRKIQRRLGYWLWSHDLRNELLNTDVHCAPDSAPRARWNEYFWTQRCHFHVQPKMILQSFDFHEDVSQPVLIQYHHALQVFFVWIRNFQRGNTKCYHENQSDSNRQANEERNEYYTQLKGRHNTEKMFWETRNAIIRTKMIIIVRQMKRGIK